MSQHNKSTDISVGTQNMSSKQPEEKDSTCTSVSSVVNGSAGSEPAHQTTNGRPGAMYRARKPVEIKPSTPEELSDANTLIEAKINNKKVMVFSKSFCPFCKKAKNIFQEYIKNGDLCEDDYDVMEIQGREDMNAIQNQLKVTTGARSVCLKFVSHRILMNDSFHK